MREMSHAKQIALVLPKKNKTILAKTTTPVFLLIFFETNLIFCKKIRHCSHLESHCPVRFLFFLFHAARKERSRRKKFPLAAAPFSRVNYDINLCCCLLRYCA